MPHKPESFAEALSLQMSRHGDTAHRLHRALKGAGATSDQTTLVAWRRGRKEPQSEASLKTLAAIEARYRLKARYFVSFLGISRAVARPAPPGVSRAEARRLAWHLPDDFSSRSASEQSEILDWIRNNILTTGTAYARYHASAAKQRFGLQFDTSIVPVKGGRPAFAARLQAPRRLQEEMRRLVEFKSATLTEIGFQRSGVWGAETAAQRGEHLSLLFGSLAADPNGEVRGLGLPIETLTFAMLISPAIWDWHVRWREERRGFFTRWEAEMLLLAAALARRETGWLRQNAWLAERLEPVAGMLDADRIREIREDWDGACDALHKHALIRAKEINRVAQVHRDPFEPLLPVLEAASPVSTYNSIAVEVARNTPDERRYPRAAAEAVRGFLMLRLGLHLGVRQKNLRQLLVCARDGIQTPERDLERMKRGELRWSRRDQGWEVFIPCAAFKNSGSSYFAKKPYRLLLPDLGGLYAAIDAYVERHRPVLLGPAADPGVLFIKTVKRSSRDASYNQTTFYEAWRLLIQRYGIYNPYTGRGAIPGLLPHGPHSVRDVLATHVLKVTGSYEQASYAIQDTAKTVAEHYGRFLPQDKAALAARVLNAVWADAA